MIQNKTQITVCLNDESYFEFSNGLWTGKKQPLLKVNVIRNTNFTSFGKIDTSDIASIEVDKKQFENKKLLNGDIVIERSGGGPKQPVGRVVYFDLNENENFSFSNFTSLIRSKDKSKIKPRFLFYSLLNFYFNEDIQRYQAQTTGLRNLDFNKYKDAVSILLLDSSEQNKIIHTLDLILTAIQKQEVIISTTTELKNALMEKLFTEGTKGEKQKETAIGLVPKSWQVVELNKTGDVIYGIQAAVANNTKPIGTKILTNVNINLEGKIVLEKVRYYKLKSKRDFNTTLQQGDILFNWRSGSKEHVGKTAIFDLEGEYTHSSFILRIRPNEKVDNYFLFLYLFYLRATGYFVKQQTYSINAKFNKSAIDILPVTLPSLEEQKIISTAIKSVNAKLDHHNLKKETLTNLFKTMLHQLMTGEIRVNDLKLEKEYKITEPKLSIAAEG